MTASPETLTAEVPDVDALRVTDRCDCQCEAQAYVRVLLPLSVRELVFCAHHFTENELALLAVGAVVVEDNRARLGSPSSPAERTTH